MTPTLKTFALTFLAASAMQAQEAPAEKNAVQLLRETFPALKQGSQHASTLGKNGGLYESITGEDGAYAALSGIDANKDYRLQSSEVQKVSYENPQQSIVALKEGNAFRVTTFTNAATDAKPAAPVTEQPKDFTAAVQKIKSYISM